MPVLIELATPEHLRSASAGALTHYFDKRGEALAFYRRVRRRGSPPRAFTKEYVLYHSWLPGFVEVDASDHDAVRYWMHDRGVAPPLSEELTQGLASLGWCTAGATADVGQLLEKAFTVFPAIQNPTELRQFLDEVQARRPQTVVEIGTGAGGTLYCLSQLAHPEALIVSIDDPEAVDGEGPDDEERALLRSFAGPRQQLELISDRSFNHSTRADLAALLADRPVDLLLIDGDHSYGGVRSDFEMYRDLVGEDGLIAFHDIMMFPDTWGRGFDVGLFWREIAADRPSREIVDPDAPLRPPGPDSAARLGMPALGFGFLLPWDPRRPQPVDAQENRASMSPLAVP